VKAGIMDDAEGYDPTRDLAVLVMQYEPTGPDGGAVSQALSRLRGHLDLRTVETIEAGLRALYGKDA